jgi:hypothetical protein
MTHYSASACAAALYVAGVSMLLTYGLLTIVAWVSPL